VVYQKNQFLTIVLTLIFLLFSSSSNNSLPITAGVQMQLSMLFQREIRNIVRDKGALFGRFGVTIFLNLLFGLIFLNSGNGDDGNSVDFNAHFGGIVMVTISSMFGSAQPVMVSER